MCGIAGWINLEKDISSQEEIMASMSHTLRNRGPDAKGEWFSPHAMLVHRRLSVVDPAGGAQPMIRTRDGFSYVITYNGELYNSDDLRGELLALGYTFKSRCDTEVLLVSYIEWGARCVEKLNGIFAFGIWNEKDSEFFMARDRFGVKPLFYSFTEESLLFGSELKTLLAHPLVKPRLSKEGLAEVFSLSPSRTPGHGIYEKVYEVRPATALVLNREGLKEKIYWRLVSEPHTDSPEETIEKVSFWVKDAVKRQLVSDVPLCTFLSGGLDSSIISAVAALSFKDEGKSPLDTFSIDYTDNDKYFKPSLFQPNTDAPWVKRMSESFNTRHHYINIDTPDLVSALRDAVLARDLPGMADVDSSLYLFCREIKKLATVGLSGECADEVFGGYPWFHNREFFDADTFPWSRSLDERVRVMSDDLIHTIKPYNYVRQRYLETLEQVPGLAGEDPTEKRRREIFFLNITWFMGTLLDAGAD